MFANTALVVNVIPGVVVYLTSGCFAKQSIDNIVAIPIGALLLPVMCSPCFVRVCVLSLLSDILLQDGLQLALAY